MLWLIGILLVCHYLADYSHLTRPWMLAAKVKGSPVWHWYVFGADQLLHQLVILSMVYLCM